MLKAGIVGLPNVGKSSLFNCLTNANVLAANYPFATIEPNKGVVSVKDERLNFLANIYKPKSIVYTSFEFIDIAGLVKGASKGEGLGNQFLSQIREVDAICQVVRFFEDNDIHHLNGVINPLDDAKTIKLELALSDLEIIEKRIPKLEKKMKANEKGAKEEYKILSDIKDAILNEKDYDLEKLNQEEKKLIKSYNFLFLKPIIYLLNISDNQILNFENDPKFLQFKKEIIKDQSYIPVSVKLELDLNQIDDESLKQEFMDSYNLKDTAINSLIKKTYNTLNLRTFFTVGRDECRAWTFKNNQTAYDCAGVIHTDFQKGFIAAEVLAYDDFVKFGSYENAKANGKVRIEGKNYTVKDGDIILFRFNV